VVEMKLPRKQPGTPIGYCPKLWIGQLLDGVEIRPGVSTSVHRAELCCKKPSLDCNPIRTSAVLGGGVIDLTCQFLFPAPWTGHRYVGLVPRLRHDASEVTSFISSQ